MGQTTDDLLVMDITLRLTLRGDYWSSPEKWDWTDLLDLEGSENVEVTACEGIRRIFPDGSTIENRKEG